MNWTHDLDAALAAAKKSGRKVLLEFGADWWGACHQLEAELSDPRVEPLLASFVPVKVDLTDRSPTNPQAPVAMKYGVRYLPDLRVLSGDGSQVGTIDPTDADDLVAQLKAHVKS